MDKIFKALASEPRRRILLHLIDEPMTVGEIADNFEMATPSVSKHLALLKQAGLVRDQKQGQYVFYTLQSARLTGEIDAFLAQFRKNG